MNCVVLFRHEYAIRCEDGAVFLRCARCGSRSRGWDVEERREPAEARADATQQRRFPVLGREKA